MISSGKIQHLQLKVLKCIISLIPVLPLYISYSMPFPYITGRNFAFRILVEIATALWIPLAVADKRYRLDSSFLTLSVFTFTFTIGIADMFGINPYNSFWSNYERMEGYVTILHLLFYFIRLRYQVMAATLWLCLMTI